MSSFSFLGSAYMFFLIALLVVALGAGASFLFRFFTDTVNGIKTHQQQSKGGNIVMENNPWLRYALYSFLGILILVAVLGLVMPGQTGYSSNMMSNNNGMMQNNQMAQMQSARPMGNSAMTSGGMQMNGVMVVPMSNGGVAIMPINNGMAASGGGMQMNAMSASGGMGMMPMGNMSGGGGMQMNAMPASGGMGMMPMGNMSGGGGMSMNTMPAGGGMGMMQMGGGNAMPAGGSGMGMMNMMPMGNMSGGAAQNQNANTSTMPSSSSSGGMGGMM